MSKLTKEQIAEIIQRENGRVGLYVEDRHGRAYWVTDVSADGRLRVISDVGEPCWWNESAQEAVPIRKHVFREFAKVVAR